MRAGGGKGGRSTEMAGKKIRVTAVPDTVLPYHATSCYLITVAGPANLKESHVEYGVVLPRSYLTKVSFGQAFHNWKGVY